MRQFTELERFTIKDRGTMIMVPPVDLLREELKELVGQTVEIDGKLYDVRGYEDCLVNHHKVVDGHFVAVACWKPLGLLVKEYSGDG
jgi:hypothetical protein